MLQRKTKTNQIQTLNNANLTLKTLSSSQIGRSNSDKRKAVMTLLEDPEGRQWSDRYIARQTLTSQPFVSKLRAKLIEREKLNLTDNVISNNPKTRIYITKYGTIAKMNTSNIGKSKLTNKVESKQAKVDKQVTTSSFRDNKNVYIIDAGTSPFQDHQGESVKRKSITNDNDLVINLINKVSDLDEIQLTTLLNACNKLDPSGIAFKNSTFFNQQPFHGKKPLQAKIYINRQIVAANKKASKETGTIVDEPAVAINTYRGSIYAHEVVLSGNAKLIQDSANPLSSGATIWIEAQFFDLIIDGQKASLDMFNS